MHLILLMVKGVNPGSGVNGASSRCLAEAFGAYGPVREAGPGQSHGAGNSARAPKGCTARVGKAMLRLRSCGVWRHVAESAGRFGEYGGIRGGGGDRLVREAGSIEVGTGMLGGAVGGAAGRPRAEWKLTTLFVALH